MFNFVFNKKIIQKIKKIEKDKKYERFGILFKRVLVDEGGETNDKRDRGGRTKYGISKAANPNVNFNTLTKEEAKKIYWDKYFIPAGCEKLPVGIDYYIFYIAVNSGVSTAKKMVIELMNLKSSDLEKTLLFIHKKRIRQIAGYSHSFATFGRGWIIRADRVFDFSLADLKKRK